VREAPLLLDGALRADFPLLLALVLRAAALELGLRPLERLFVLPLDFPVLVFA
jgi:hypothetical protein